MAEALNTGILKEKSHQGPGTRGQGPGTKDQGSGLDSDQVARVGLGPEAQGVGEGQDHGVSCSKRELDQGFRESGRDSDPTLRVASPT